MKKFRIKDKHLIIIMTIVCIGLIVMSLSVQRAVPAVQNAASYVIVPFQKSINEIGSWVSKKADAFKSAEELAEENRQLKAKIDELTMANNEYVQEQQEVERLEELYKLDCEFPDYEKVACQVIAKDPGNWYNIFTINKGTEDGVDVDMNVIGDGGLIGIVTEAGRHWAKVRSIIDDESNISAMVVRTGDICTVSGSLTDMVQGKINFFGLRDEAESLGAGDMLVTSNISEKFVPGLTIGYITEIENDSNNITKIGKLTPVADFRQIREVLVITALKETGNADDSEDSAEG
ncbi:MAG: rod shape-determining protein MreC [Lachnospiraceae bacterium]|jgi:rod shape-determining protein MreC